MKINDEARYLWRAVDHEGEVLEVLFLSDAVARQQWFFLRNLRNDVENLM